MSDWINPEEMRQTDELQRTQRRLDELIERMSPETFTQMQELARTVFFTIENTQSILQELEILRQSDDYCIAEDAEVMYRKFDEYQGYLKRQAR